MDNYNVFGILGKGTYATVFDATRKVDMKPFALKIFNLNTPQDIIHNEVIMMQHLMQYPQLDNIVKVEELFVNAKKQHVISMEKLCGGELFDKIISRGHFSESDAATCMKTFVHALNRLHTEAGVIHRDIKPENIVYVDGSPNSEFKIVDFGLSIRCSRMTAEAGVVCKDLVGTKGYIAPESIQSLHYSVKSDIWSAGVILYCILAGIPPFNSEDKYLTKRIVRGQYYPLESQYWEHISEPAKDLVRRMLTVDPAKRISATEILNHPWIKQNAVQTPSVSLGTDYLQRIKKLSCGHKFRKVVRGIIWTHRVRKMALQSIIQKNSEQLMPSAATMQSMAISGVTGTDLAASSAAAGPGGPGAEVFIQSGVSAFTSEQLTALREKFVRAGLEEQKLNEADSSDAAERLMNEGIRYNAFCEIVESVGLQYLAQPHVFRLFDNDGNGRVDYKEFLMALVAFHSRTHDVIRLYFDIFDSDGNGSISFEELTFVVASVYTNFHDNEVEGVMTAGPSLDEMDQGASEAMMNTRQSSSDSHSPRSADMSTPGWTTFDNLHLLFEAIDTNHDGSISFEEFEEWIKKDADFLPSVFIQPMHCRLDHK